MTLLELATFVCGKVGQSDTASLAACKTFVKRRYQLCYDAFPWADTQIRYSDAASAGTSYINKPATVERIISMAVLGTPSTFLEPVSANFLIQTDINVMYGSGTPQYYEEYTDLNDAVHPRKVRIYPTPDVDSTFLVIGRRIRPELDDDSDSPIIRTIDNALIAYAHGDMLQRARHYAKAKELYEEAGALLTAAKNLETEQTAKPRQTKTLTAAGNSLLELTDAVCARINVWALEKRIIIKDMLRRNYQMIYDRELWKESLVVVTVASDGEQLVLPSYIDRVVDVRADASLGALIPSDTGTLFHITPTIFEQTTGTQFSYTTLPPSATAVVPPGRERIAIVSTHNEKPSMFIRGSSAGEIQTETVVLTGTTPKLTYYSYDVLFSAPKPVTTGTITLTGDTSTVLLQTLGPTEIERKHVRLRLHPGNTTGTDCLILGKLAIRPFQSDEDTPMLRSIQGALIDLTVGDMLDHLDKNGDKHRAKGEAAIKGMIALEQQQGASAPRVIPFAEPSAYESDYGLSKSGAFY